MSDHHTSNIDLLDALNSHPGKRILDALHVYQATTNVLVGNAHALRILIRKLEDPADPFTIGPQERHRELQRLFGEVFRLFHNFLASVMTLVEHTRNLVKEDFVTPEHRAEYDETVERSFASDPFTKFMQDFRNYVLHHAVPEIKLTHHIFPAPERIELTIDATKMLASKRLSSLAACRASARRASGLVAQM